MTLKNEDFDTIRKAPLMQGLTSGDVKTAIDHFAVDVLVCSGMYSIYELKKYSMIILEGFIDIISITLNGDEHIISRFSAGSYIPNGLMCSKSASSPFLPSVSKNCRILVIDQEKIHHCNCNLFGNCIDNCNQEYALSPLLLSRINYNMAVLLNDILIHLSEKLQIITQKTLSEKLSSYFHILANKTGSSRFTLPFTRDELAKYIFAERSSVSREINHMQNEQLIKLYSSKDIELLPSTPT